MNMQARVSAVFERDAGILRHVLPPQEHDPLLSSVVDGTGRLVEVSDGLCAMLGFNRGDLVGRDQSELLAGNYSPVFLQEACSFLEVGGSWRGNLCHRAKDGGVLWFDCLMTPVRGSDSLINHVVTLRAGVSIRSPEQPLGPTNARFLSQIGRAANVGGWELDLDTGLTCWTDETFRIHGLEKGCQPSLAEALSHYPEDARTVISAAVERAAKDGSGWCLELPFIQRGGNAIWVRVVGEAEFFCGKPWRLFGAIQDITEIVSKRVEVERLNERMALATENGSIGIWEYELATDILHWDRMMSRLFGCPDASLVGTLDLWARHLHPQDREDALAACAKAIADGETLNTEFRIIRADGEVRHIRAAAKVTFDPASRATKLIGVNWDITERRRLVAEMQHRATHDTLTGLMNRNAFEERVSEAITLADPGHPIGALLSIDLDQFKLVNNACGHAVGDRLLQQVTVLLQDHLSVGDVLARLGSDEFAILTPVVSLSLAEALAASICNRLDEFRFNDAGRRFRISASIGVVPLDARWVDVASALQAACTACSEAKEEGRNRYHTWHDTDEALHSRHGETHWATRIEQALDEDRFALYAQIITPIAAPVGPLRAEVLLRMVETDGTLILPGVFVPAAERFHLASRIDRWVLKNALGWLAQLEAPCAVGTLCINLSGQSIGDRAFRQHVVEALTAAGLALSQKVCLEITETSAITNLDSAAAFMAEVRSLGVRVALDDFGSGSSSFGYLRKLPIDYLKIDGQFIRELTSGSLDEAAVRCFTDVARLIGVKTVAEFIETPDVLSRLAEIGVDYGQGYLLHKPIPISQLLMEDACTHAAPARLASC